MFSCRVDARLTNTNTNSKTEYIAVVRVFAVKGAPVRLIF